MNQKNNWYEVRDVNRLDTPALIIFPERVAQNIQRAIQLVGDPRRLRPHIKTNKSPQAVRLLLEAGIHRFKCATIAEAEMLAMEGAEDVLLAYQPIGPKLDRLVALVKKYPDTQFSCLCDNLIAAKEQSQAFVAAGLQISVYLDLNVGMNRTGIEPGAGAFELYRFLSNAPGIIAKGLHAYDGHLRDPDIEARTIACDRAFQSVSNLVQSLEANGMNVKTIIAGGSPTFPIHAKRKNVECSPGTFIYWDKTYLDGCPEQPFVPAALLLTRVISLPGIGRVCTDLGHKSVAAENELDKRVFFLNAQGLKAIGQSEEHLVLETDESNSLSPGDVLYGIPYHVCPTIALYERAYTIVNGTITGEWQNTARDRRITI